MTARKRASALKCGLPRRPAGHQDTQVPAATPPAGVAIRGDLGLEVKVGSFANVARDVPEETMFALTTSMLALKTPQG